MLGRPHTRGSSWALALRPPAALQTLSSSLQASSRRRSPVKCSSSSGEEQADGGEEEVRPRLYGDFVRRPLISPYKRTNACRRCTGSGSVPCGQCGGTGRLARGGYQKRNPVVAARVIGSKWTAMERTFGWRHFRAVQKQGKGQGTLVLMQATCEETTQFWVNMQNLKDRDRWASGWLQKVEIKEAEAQRAQQAAAAEEQQQQQGVRATSFAARPPGSSSSAAGTVCRACTGSGALPCPLCSLAGQVVEL